MTSLGVLFLNLLLKLTGKLIVVRVRFSVLSFRQSWAATH